jgi:hypothetical protein
VVVVVVHKLLVDHQQEVTLAGVEAVLEVVMAALHQAVLAVQAS